MLRRRLEALERNAPSAAAGGPSVIFLVGDGEPGGAFVKVGKQFESVTRLEGETAEAFEARCNAMAGE